MYIHMFRKVLKSFLGTTIPEEHLKLGFQLGFRVQDSKLLSEP